MFIPPTALYSARALLFQQVSFSIYLYLVVVASESQTRALSARLNSLAYPIPGQPHLVLCYTVPPRGSFKSYTSITKITFTRLTLPPRGLYWQSFLVQQAVTAQPTALCPIWS